MHELGGIKRHSSNSRKVSWQKFHNYMYLAQECSAHCVSKIQRWIWNLELPTDSTFKNLKGGALTWLDCKKSHPRDHGFKATCWWLTSCWTLFNLSYIVPTICLFIGLKPTLILEIRATYTIKNFTGAQASGLIINHLLR